MKMKKEEEVIQTQIEPSRPTMITVVVKTQKMNKLKRMNLKVLAHGVVKTISFVVFDKYHQTACRC